MNRFGDTPLGMVESALEFARIARKHDYHNFLFSMKSSNPKVMIECYRLLVARLAELGADWSYPIHLGVTEAGEGEDARIKSAIGIGSLLCDGLGDTIRVSLTEDSPREIDVCRDLLAQIPALTVAAAASPRSGLFEHHGTDNHPDHALTSAVAWPFDPFTFQRRQTPEIELNETCQCGGEQTVRVVVTRSTWDKVVPKIRPKDDVKPEAIYEDLNVCEIDPAADFEVNCETQLVTVKDEVKLPAIAAFRLLAAKLNRLGLTNPILLKDCLIVPEEPLRPEVALLRASVVIGSLLADGIGDAILVRGESGAGMSLRLAYNILQAAGCRSFKTDYVACPSCGRTLFDLQSTTARIKAATSHLKGVKIAIMGCIVNGPGEMADADFGYVGGAPGKVNLYVGKTAVKFNIPEREAVERLKDLIREHGKWMEPREAPAEVA
jgi:(E)-4-hydroxy-3-methylbut-2-enyl-diphosphate synthase